MTEDVFSDRKREHILLSLQGQMQTSHLSGFDQIHLTHEALPDLNWSDLSVSQVLQFSQTKISLRLPLIVSSMTAGHPQSAAINRILVQFTESQGLMMGVGSQRRELQDPKALNEWREIRKAHSMAVLFSNLGLAQLISEGPAAALKLVDNLEAQGIYIHLNPLQEALQPEGTPQFAGGAKAIEALVKSSAVPVIVKETGSGMSKATLQKLKDLGVAGVEVSGLGGTHWGRIEGARALNQTAASSASEKAKAAITFQDWGLSTVESLRSARELGSDWVVIGAGGVRTGLDAAKCLALGAQAVGMAKPFLDCFKGLEPGETLDEQSTRKSLQSLVEVFEFELKTALFCTGSQSLESLRPELIYSR